MRRAARAGRWLVGSAVALGMLGLTPALRAEPLQAGTRELALAGGYSLSHNELVGNVGTLEGYHLIPHVGYFLTDEAGAGWLRGSLELVTEPTLLVIEGRGTTTLAGVAVLGRWMFAGTARVRPYLEAGGGVLGGSLRLRRTSCDVAFALQVGTGALLFLSERTAITAGYRFQHLSNGSVCGGNPGLDSSAFVLGVSRFFP